MDIYDRQSVRLRLKMRMLEAEVLETLLYGCATWSPSKADFDRLRKAHHQNAPPMPPLAETKARKPHPVLYQRASPDTDFESVETTVGRRRILIAGLVARMGEEHLPRRVMFGEMLWVKKLLPGTGVGLDEGP